jgi:hypothetical protein
MSDVDLKLAVMEVLRGRALTVSEIGVPSAITMVLLELIADGYVVRVPGSTAPAIYQHAHDNALSDLRCKLLPHRDPVREAHLQPETQGRVERKGQHDGEGADLEIEADLFSEIVT